MASGANWLVLDEPTNHLDLPAIEQLESALERLRRHAAARHPRPPAARGADDRPHDRARARGLAALRPLSPGRAAAPALERTQIDRGRFGEHVRQREGAAGLPRRSYAEADHPPVATQHEIGDAIDPHKPEVVAPVAGADELHHGLADDGEVVLALAAVLADVGHPLAGDADEARTLLASENGADLPAPAGRSPAGEVAAHPAADEHDVARHPSPVTRSTVSPALVQGAACAVAGTASPATSAISAIRVVFAVRISSMGVTRRSVSHRAVSAPRPPARRPGPRPRARRRAPRAALRRGHGGGARRVTVGFRELGENGVVRWAPTVRSSRPDGPVRRPPRPSRRAARPAGRGDRRRARGGASWPPSHTIVEFTQHAGDEFWRAAASARTGRRARRLST